MQTVPESIDKTLSHYAEICEIAAAVSREDVQLYYQICLLGRKVRFRSGTRSRNHR